jgi:hypothetical protein
MADTNFDSIVLDTGGITLNGITLTVVGEASETYDAGSIADGNEEVGELTVTGAALGDYTLASITVDVADLAITAAVTAANTVTYQLNNNTGGAIDLASATVKVLVIHTA